MAGLQQGFSSAFERFFEAAQSEEGEDAENYGLLDLSAGTPTRAYQPLLGITELRLSRAGYAKVVKAMQEALHNVGREEATEAGDAAKPCTVAVVLYQGRAISSRLGT